MSNYEIFLKILKIIAIISYMFIFGLNAVSLPLCVFFLFSFYNFFQSFGYINSGIDWELGVAAVLSSATIFIFLKSKIFKDRYVFILCFLGLLLLMISETGILERENYIYMTNWFTIPMLIFVGSSILIIILSFVGKQHKF